MHFQLWFAHFFALGVLHPIASLLIHDFLHMPVFLRMQLLQLHGVAVMREPYQKNGSVQSFQDGLR